MLIRNPLAKVGIGILYGWLIIPVILMLISIGAFVLLALLPVICLFREVEISKGMLTVARRYK